MPKAQRGLGLSLKRVIQLTMPSGEGGHELGKFLRRNKRVCVDAAALNFLLICHLIIIPELPRLPRAQLPLWLTRSNGGIIRIWLSHQPSSVRAHSIFGIKGCRTDEVDDTPNNPWQEEGIFR